MGTNFEFQLHVRKQTWIDLLRKEMSKYDPEDVWFVTLAPGRQVSDETIEKNGKSWLFRLYDANRNRNGDEGKDIRSFGVISRQQRGVLHPHLLIAGKGLRYLNKGDWEFRWRKLAGPGSSCKILEANKNAPAYMLNKRNFTGDNIVAEPFL